MGRKQCKLCPWRVGVDPMDIPNGYSPELHANLKRTIAEPGAYKPDETLRVQGCHLTPAGKEVICIGYLHNQLGIGNNIALRIAMRRGKFDPDYVLDGPQHRTFEDTLPKEDDD